MALIAFPSVAKTIRLGQQLHQPQSVLMSEYSGQRHTMRLGDGRWAGTARITVDTLTPAAVQEVLTWIGALADGANWTALPLGVDPVLDDSNDPPTFVSGFIHDGTRLRMKHNTAAEGDPAVVRLHAIGPGHRLRDPDARDPRQRLLARQAGRLRASPGSVAGLDRGLRVPMD